MMLISLLLIVGLIVAVPLGLDILSERPLHPWEQPILKMARQLHPLAILSVASSFIVLPGRLSAGLTVPWLLFGALLGSAALLRLVKGGWRQLSTFCHTAALGYLPVGAAWLFASRAGINPMGFGEPIILLTAVHFHFSGFAASVLAGEVLRHGKENAFLNTWIALGALLGMPIIASGFVFSAPLKLVGIVFFSSTLVTLAAKQFLTARSLAPGRSKQCLVISSLSVICGMGLALLYGITEYADWPMLTVPQMAYSHGILNAFGFTGCGLYGWRSIVSREAIHG